MFRSVRVVGRGRVGTAVAARLAERGCTVTGRHDPTDAGELVLICVPDAAIVDTARAFAPGPWVAHVSGATHLAALEPHRARFSVHPLQTFVRWRGPEQLDGAWAAVTAESEDARSRARWLAETLGLMPFDLADDRRALYHAGASMASNFLVTLFRAASRALSECGAPPDALVPLMRRTIDNQFELTGPIARGDRVTVDAHLAALERDAPDMAPLYRALAAMTRP